MSHGRNLERALTNHSKATSLLDQIELVNLKFLTDDEKHNQKINLANDAMEYINACIKFNPANPAYLNTKALILASGFGEVGKAVKMLRKANSIDPDDITIRQNLRKLESILMQQNVADRRRKLKKNIIMISFLAFIGIFAFIQLMIYLGVKPAD